jgi:positive regulator of sigma E activity
LPERAAFAVNALSGGNPMSSFSTYIVGFIILVVGLALAAYLLDVPAMWIAVGVIVLIGIGVLMATSRTKPRDPPVV